jgi:hypothetical protein
MERSASAGSLHHTPDPHAIAEAIEAEAQEASPERTGNGL